jgi:hypothetical protein
VIARVLSISLASAGSSHVSRYAPKPLANPREAERFALSTTAAVP